MYFANFGEKLLFLLRFIFISACYEKIFFGHFIPLFADEKLFSTAF